jgi:hypothetical protein
MELYGTHYFILFLKNSSFFKIMESIWKLLSEKNHERGNFLSPIHDNKNYNLFFNVNRERYNRAIIFLF